jgi:hypothetical protein
VDEGKTAAKPPSGLEAQNGGGWMAETWWSRARCACTQRGPIHTLYPTNPGMGLVFGVESCDIVEDRFPALLDGVDRRR